jgi:hypothetical protein
MNGLVDMLQSVHYFLRKRLGGLPICDPQGHGSRPAAF